MKVFDSRANRKSFWNLESPITYHSDSSYNETLGPVSINSIDGLCRTILTDHKDVASSDKDVIPIVKWVHSGISDTLFI